LNKNLLLSKLQRLFSSMRGYGCCCRSVVANCCLSAWPVYGNHNYLLIVVHDHSFASFDAFYVRQSWSLRAIKHEGQGSPSLS